MSGDNIFYHPNIPSVPHPNPRCRFFLQLLKELDFMAVDASDHLRAISALDDGIKLFYSNSVRMEEDHGIWIRIATKQKAS